MAVNQAKITDRHSEDASFTTSCAFDYEVDYDSGKIILKDDVHGREIDVEFAAIPPKNLIKIAIENGEDSAAAIHVEDSDIGEFADKNIPVGTAVSIWTQNNWDYTIILTQENPIDGYHLVGNCVPAQYGSVDMTEDNTMICEVHSWEPPAPDGTLIEFRCKYIEKE